MTYQELLETEEWKQKRKEILTRDSNICQRCGISAKDGNSTRPLQIKKNLVEQFEVIEFFKEKSQKANLVLLKFKDSVTYVKSYLNELNKKENCDYTIMVNFIKKDFLNYPYQGSILNNNKKNFLQDNKKNVWLNNAYNKVNDESLSFELDLEGMWLVKWEEHEPYIKNCSSLEVHHKCYRENKMIWAQEDSEYVTLCNICHLIVHETTRIPFYDKYGVDFKYRQDCSRCRGTGYLKHYSYYKNGVCFECQGLGFEKYYG